MAYSITINNLISNNLESFLSRDTSVRNSESVIVHINDINGLVISDNDTDVTENFVSTSVASISRAATSYTTSGSFTNTANVTGAAGYTAESPASTSTSNAYAKSGTTARVYYTFDFSAIPSDATISSVEVKAYGGAESSNYTSGSKECSIQLYSGSTVKGSKSHFSSTSNTILTVSSPGTWTRSELQNAKACVIVAYYGGRVRGITWTVKYVWEGYTYTISNIAENHIITIDQSIQRTLYYKKNGNWKIVKKVYKKINNTWESQRLHQVFNSTDNFVYKNT